MEYDKQAQGVVVSLGGATPVVIPFTPTAVEIFNATRSAATGVVKAWWQIEMGQGAAGLTTIATTGTTPTVTADLDSYIASATGGGILTFQAALSNQFGAPVAITTVTKNAGSPLVTTTAPHGLVSGDIVIFQNLYQTATTGMQQLCGIPFVVAVTGAATFTISIDNSGAMFAAYDIATATAQATMKQVLYPFLYAPGVSDIADITLGATTTVDTTSPHNFVVGQMVAFRIPSAYGTVELNSMSNVVIPGSPIYGFVTAVNNPLEVVVNINSSAYTAFTQPTVAQVLAGLAPAQILAVGDNNYGSGVFGYGSPIVNGTSTINGPAVAGAYLNNSNQGFIIGPSVAGAASDVIYWRAAYSSIV